HSPAYLDDDSEVLISKATWPIKLSGIIAAGLLVIGRSASYGNVTWTPAFHPASSPLVVIINNVPKPAPLPAVPKTVPSVDPALISKRSAASEIIAFHPGKASGEGDGESNGSPAQAHNSAVASTGAVPGESAGSPAGAHASQASTGAA